MNQPRNRIVFRKQYIVDSRIQFRLLAIVLVSAVANILIFSGYLAYLIYNFNSNLNLMTTVPSNEKMQLITFAKSMLREIYFISSALSLMIVFYVIAYSNRFAGPVFSMTRTLKDHLAGKTDRRIRIRKNDYFQELAMVINQVLDKHEGLMKEKAGKTVEDLSSSSKQSEDKN